MRIRTMLQMARRGNFRERLRAVRDGQAAVRMAAVGAGLRTGVLDHLHEAPGTAQELAKRAGWSDERIFEGLLQVLAGMGLVRASADGWELAGRGRAVLGDDVVRATYEGFSGYHTDLYDHLERQLTGVSARRDVIEKGNVIARLSRAMDPFVLDALGKEVRERQPRRVLDVGCATGSHLAHMLRVLPTATGLGIEIDHAAAALARVTLTDSGLASRAEVVEGDARQVLDASIGGFGFALLSNVIYYLPVRERVPLLRAVAERLEPGGALMVVTTALTDAPFSRHFDLLLRAQAGEMELPATEVLADQLRQAGLVPSMARRITPGESLTAIVASKA